MLRRLIVDSADGGVGTGTGGSGMPAGGSGAGDCGMVGGGTGAGDIGIPGCAPAGAAICSRNCGLRRRDPGGTDKVDTERDYTPATEEGITAYWRQPLARATAAPCRKPANQSWMACRPSG